MIYVVPETEILSVEHDGETCSFELYKPHKSISGVADENYPVWDPDTPYATGEYVIVQELKRIYRSAADGNQGVFPPSDQTMWVDYGFVNSYRMYSIDEGIGAATSGTDVVLEFDFTTSDTIAMIGAKWSKVLVEQVDNDEPPITGETLGTGDGTTKTFSTAKKPVYSKSETVYVDGVEKVRDTNYTIDYFTGEITFSTAPASGAVITIDYTKTLKTIYIPGRDYGASNFYEYFYAPLSDETRLIVDDLEWMPNSTLRLSFEGEVEIGVFVVGLKDDLGATLYGTKMGFRDKSKIVVDEFTGARKIIRYGKIRVMNAEITEYTDEYSNVARKVNSIIGKNVLFIPAEDERFSEMANIAYIESADLPVENPSRFKASMSIVGVME